MLPALRQVMHIGWPDIREMTGRDLAAHLNHLSTVLDIDLHGGDPPPG